jgi:hypothetical protein
VIAVRPQNLFASHKPLQERNGRVPVEGTEDQERKPERPDIFAPADQAERRGKKTERNRTNVA